MSAAAYEALAGVLAYPDARWSERLAACRREVAAADAACAERLERFAGEIGSSSTAELEELYARTFDFSPACTLEVGWHLFGEEYGRGAFLVRLRGLLRRHGVHESSELPDHLTHVLALLGRLPQDEAGDLAAACVLPALGKVLAALEGQGSPYGELLRAVQAFLSARHGSPGAPGESPAFRFPVPGTRSPGLEEGGEP